MKKMLVDVFSDFFSCFFSNSDGAKCWDQHMVLDSALFRGFRIYQTATSLTRLLKSINIYLHIVDFELIFILRNKVRWINLRNTILLLKYTIYIYSEQARSAGFCWLEDY